MSSRRNVILIVLDSARADAFGHHTPNFLEFSSSGVRFERAITAAGWTLPSHVSMFTGLLPTEHGIVGLPGGSERVLRNARRRVGELVATNKLLAPNLKALGYSTFSVTASPWLSRGSGLDAGFDTTEFFNFMQLPPRTRRTLPKRLRQSADTIRSVGDHARWVSSGRDKGATRVLNRLLAFLKETTGPFFATTTLMETHEPHFPMTPRGGLGWYAGNVGAIGNTVLQPGLVRLVRMHAHNWGSVGLSQRTIARWKSAYASEIGYVDRWLGDVVQQVERAGALDETVFILTADHGETWGEGGTVGHGISLREGLANVPLAIWGAGIEPSAAIADPVSLRHVAATVMGLANNESEPGILSSSARGRAVMEVEEPSHVAHPPPRPKRRSVGPGAAFYEGTRKLVSEPFEDAGGAPLLYDLVTDPAETRPLTDAPTEWQIEQLEMWRKRTQALEGSLRA